MPFNGFEYAFEWRVKLVFFVLGIYEYICIHTEILSMKSKNNNFNSDYFTFKLKKNVV